MHLSFLKQGAGGDSVVLGGVVVNRVLRVIARELSVLNSIAVAHGTGTVVLLNLLLLNGRQEALGRVVGTYHLRLLFIDRVAHEHNWLGILAVFGRKPIYGHSAILKLRVVFLFPLEAVCQVLVRAPTRFFYYLVCIL